MNLDEARKILGLSENDGADEAKKKYRNLSKKYHPDVNKETGAEDNFKKINKAYECVKNGKGNDPESNFHDFRGGPTWGDFGFANPFHKSRHIRIEHIQKDITISFKESVQGCKKNITFRRKIKCEECLGEGSVRLNNGCERCGGSGMINSIHGNMIISQTCPACLGSVKNENCTSCSGNGSKDGTTSLEITIPPGIMDGNALRIQGMGNYAGKMMGMDQASDIHVVISVIQESGLFIEGKDVISHINISLLDALKGVKKQVKTIDGMKEIEIKPRSKNQDNVIISKLGVAKIGDHRVILEVDYPSDIDSIIQILEKDK